MTPRGKKDFILGTEKFTFLILALITKTRQQTRPVAFPGGGSGLNDLRPPEDIFKGLLPDIPINRETCGARPPVGNKDCFLGGAASDMIAA
jgi:hypothetical protein